MALIKFLKQIVNSFVLYICCYSNFKDNFLQNYGLKKTTWRKFTVAVRIQVKQENAMCCDNRDDLIQLSFT